ncbi:hypothetical protein ACHAXM_000333 [Skeletonema potamos]|jgi:hypothetical protein
MDCPPSGAAWPQSLRRKLGLPPSANTSNAAVKSADLDEFNFNPSTSSLLLLRQNQSNTEPLSSHQLRNYIHSSYAALTSIQRQLHRGEESYFEETYSHGNIFAGWDNIWIENPNSGTHGITTNSFIDGAATNNNASLSSSGGANNNGIAVIASGDHHQPVVKHFSTRKMPNDFRWFSSSNSTVQATGDGKVAELGRPSLIDRPPTPEVKEEGNSKKNVVSDKPVVTDDNTNDSTAAQPTSVMDVVSDDSNTKSQEEAVQNNDDTTSATKKDPSSTTEEKQISLQESEQITVEKDNAGEDVPSSSDSAAANVIDASVTDDAPTEQAIEPVKTESNDDAAISNEEEQKDETTDDDKDKEATFTSRTMEYPDVEMTTEDEPSQPPTSPSQISESTAKQSSTLATVDSSEKVEPSNTKEEPLTHSVTDEHEKRPAKVPKISAHDTPNSAAKTSADSGTEEEKNNNPAGKPVVIEETTTVEKNEAEENEDKDEDTKSKHETKVTPARRTTRRTRKRKAS